LPYQQPAFTAKVFDVTDNKYIDCPSFDFISGGDLPGFIQSGIVGALTIYYKDWSKATIDLHGYPNKIMRIEFTTNDCAEGGHFGYAYLDVEDSETSPPITGNSYCIGQKAVTLIGPSGFADYQWYTGDLTTLLWQGQSLTISPPPPDLTWYALKVSPYPGGGCPDILYTVVNQINSGFQLKVQDTLIGCPGIAIDLTSPSVSVGSSPGTTYKYFTDSLTSTYLVKPNTINNAGTYYIQGISKEGCTNILPVQVIFRTPTIKVTEPAAVYFPTTINLSKTFTPQTGLTYSYYRNANGTDQLTDYTAVKRSGKYYIQATNTLTGCSIVGPVDVTIIPPPPYEITTPNTFTPNGDGINDHFNFTHSGSITFGSLRIYNRNGQLLFTAKSFGQYWDGNFNGKNVPAGTYYWVFEGEDDYNNVKINKGGSITLIR
jgi:gliding motility-associated-like protein